MSEGKDTGKEDNQSITDFLLILTIFTYVSFFFDCLKIWRFYPRTSNFVFKVPYFLLVKYGIVVFILNSSRSVEVCMRKVGGEGEG